MRVLSGKRAHEAIKVLACETRWDLFNSVQRQPSHIAELADKLDKDKSTVSRHVDALEDAGLVRTATVSGERGAKKKVYSLSPRIVIDLS